MNALTPETLNFIIRAIVVVLSAFAMIVAPAAGLAIFHRMAVRLGLPTIVAELQESSTFREYVDSRCKHNNNNNDAKLGELHRMLQGLVVTVDSLGRNVAVVLDRTNHQS